MPVIAVNLTAAVFTEISTFLAEGRYASPEQFLEIAAFNQVALERGTKVGELVARRAQAIEKVAEHAAPFAEKAAPVVKERERSAAPRGKRGRKPDVNVDEIIEAFRPGVKVPATRRATSRSSNDHVWGQVNRFFPLKVASRWLAASAASSGEWQRLDDVSERLTSDAADLGTFLQSSDEAAERRRDVVLGTALPRRGNIASRERFLSQFVARTTRAGDIYPGALVQFALAEFDGDKLCLTDRGVRFSELPSAVLDGDPAAATITLGPDEKRFLVDTIRELVPSERADYARALAAVGAGDDNPDKLAEALRRALPDDWSDTMARTHVAGVVARLADLDLLERKWIGRNVTYEVPSSARSLFVSEATQ